MTPLTAAAPGGYELNSARTAITGAGSGRSVELLVDIQTSAAGVIVDHSALLSGTCYRIGVTAAGVVEFLNVDGKIKELAAPNVDGSARSYVVAWSTEPNPLTTGAGDALRSEFLVYDIAGDELVWDTEDHAVAAASPLGTFTVGGVFAGVMGSPYTPTIDAVRISSRFHTRTETRLHFLNLPAAAPTNEGIAACQAIVPPAQLFQAAAIAGPGYQAAAASAQNERDRHRTLSPVWQWQTTDAPSNSDDLRDSFSPKHVLDLEPEYGGPGWQTPISWLGCVEVPRVCAWLLVRIQWATWRTDPMGTTDKVSLRFNTSDNVPALFTTCEYREIDRTVDDVSAMGIGVNQTFDFVPVVRDAEGMTYVWISARTDDGSGSGNASYVLRACAVTPIILPDGYGGVVNGWGP